MKLIKEAIKILPEGQQIRKAILERYGSVEEFVNTNNLIINSETVKNYLRKKVVSSDRFRCNLAQIFDKDYYQIALSENDQIIRYIDIVNESIKEYKDAEDMSILQHLMDLCIERKLIVAIAKMNRAIAMFNFYRNNACVSVELLKRAIDMLEGRNENSLLISYLSELALVYFYEVKYDKANEITELIKLKLSSVEYIDSKTSFLHYYRTGILYNNTAQHLMARQMFQNALEHAGDRFHIGRTLMNIGITFKKQGQYSEAQEYYKNALESLGADDVVGISTVYNNIAEVHKMQGEYDRALEYSEKAFLALGEEYASYRFMSFYTYCEIKAQKGEIENTMDKLLELLAEVKDEFIYKKFIVTGIDFITDFAETQNNDMVIHKLGQLIIKFIKDIASEDEEYKKSLLACLGRITLYKEERGNKFEKIYT